MSARLGKMMCAITAGRECLPVDGARKRYCAHVASGRCSLTVLADALLSERVKGGEK